jgi:hypothetical protein
MEAMWMPVSRKGKKWDVLELLFLLADRLLSAIPGVIFNGATGPPGGVPVGHPNPIRGPVSNYG